MTDTKLIDPATLSGTELLLRQTYCPDTLATSPVAAPVEVVAKQALPVDEEASEEAVIAFKAALELLAVKERAAKLVEAAKKEREDKNKQ
ncbi:hypothetical protein QZR14_04510 [Pseudomonas sp. rhizo66]|uniref:hypothetical protein n=1 Tax=Pseudomonas sp. rhizo66 TaxID=3059674 RepID=UPI0028921A2C|nr:hypothetical protein [Pseudomonas sp. rhizo66]MDT3310613.1 hypothetical protein [Pseudomonas sp. rhizo66]